MSRNQHSTLSFLVQSKKATTYSTGQAFLEATFSQVWWVWNFHVSSAESYGVCPSTISRLLKQKVQPIDKWQNTNLERKRKRTGKAEDIEETLLCWFSQARSHQLSVSGPLLMEKANKLAEGLRITEFTATVGWIQRWKERNNIPVRQSLRSSTKESKMPTTFGRRDGSLKFFQTSSRFGTSLTLTKLACTGGPYLKARWRSRSVRLQEARCLKNASPCCLLATWTDQRNWSR